MSSKLSTRSRTLSTRRRNNIRARNEGHDLTSQDAPLNDNGSWADRDHEESEEEEEEEEDHGSEINGEARGRSKEAIAA